MYSESLRANTSPVTVFFGAPPRSKLISPSADTHQLRSKERRKNRAPAIMHANEERRKATSRVKVKRYQNTMIITFEISISVVLIARPKCTLATSHAAPSE